MKVSSHLSRFLKNCTENQKEIVLSYFEELTEEFKNKSIEIGERNCILHFMNEIEKKISSFIQNSQYNDLIQCKEGCSHCCYYQVEISYEEGLIILDEIEKSKIDIDWDRVEYLSKIEKEKWYQLPLEMRRCPLLGDEGQCLVYDKRPLTCRKHNVFSDPEFCRDRPNALVSGISNPMIEVLISAVMSNTRMSNLLPRQILICRENGLS
jgi:Fe-S-cluster containining protein